MQLSKQQLEVIQSKEPHVIVASCAGSGKTLCLISRYNYLISQGIDPKSIVMITFTNAAAEEMSERLGHPKGAFIGTIHAYANYILLSHGTATNDILEREAFNELFERVNTQKDIVKPIEYLLLDEGQDSTEQQFRFVFEVLKPKNWMIFADWRQSIYRWNGAFPEYLISLSKQPDVTTYELTENYRNSASVLAFAKNIISAAGFNYRDCSIPMRKVTGKVLTDINYNPTAIARTLLESFETNNTEPRDWFVLARTNDLLDELAYIFKKNGVPFDSFKRAQLDNAELNEKMRENTVKLLTIHAAKGLEANNVIVVGQRFYNLEERCISYVAATRARNMLVWTKIPNKKNFQIGTKNWER